MRNHNVQIGDRAGHAFRIHISTPSFWTVAGSGAHYDFGDSLDSDMTGIDEVRKTRDLPDGAGHLHVKHWYGGDWRSVDLGFIRYSSGKAVEQKSIGSDLTTSDVYLLNLDGTWGMKLFNYADYSGVNDEGEGTVIQPWVLGLNPGRISWSLVD